jgi:curved DNA-binding protein CbpA
MSNFETKAFINPFKLFNISSKSSLDELKKSYYELSLICHPDKGGKTEDMMVVTSAYRFIKEQLINNDDDIKINFENAEEDFQKYMDDNPIPKTPMMSEVFDEYTDFNKKFNDEFQKSDKFCNKLDKLGYQKLMVESKLKNCDENISYEELLKLENVNINKTTSENREDFKNRYINDNIKFLESNDIENKNLNENIDIFKPDYPDNARYTSLILANDPLFDNYYDYSIEKNLENIDNLDNFPEEDILKKLNIDFSGKGFSDYYQSSSMLSYDIDDKLKEKMNGNIMNKMESFKNECEMDVKKYEEKRNEIDWTNSKYKKICDLQESNLNISNEIIKSNDKIKKVNIRKNNIYKKISKLKRELYKTYNRKNELKNELKKYNKIIQINYSEITELNKQI